jgi:hypothetical protein
MLTIGSGSYHVSGKTAYALGSTIASFVGFAPVKNPAFVRCRMTC